MKTIRAKKKLNKKLIFGIFIIIVILGLAGLTKAGFIPNYFNIGFLCSKQADENYIEMNGVKMFPVVKPIIYLYPKETQQVNVKINYKGNLAFSYPEYNNG
jgi:hypothetical protein